MAKGVNRTKITKRVVDAAEPRSARYTLWDDELIGFGLRIEKSGAKSFVIRYRANGGGRNAPERLMVIGRYGGSMTPESARKLARVRLAEVATGEDPARERAEARKAMKLADLCDLYVEEGCDLKKLSTMKADRSRIERHIKPLLGSRLARDISSADVERFMRDVAAGKTARDEKTGFKGRSIVTGGKGAATRTVRLLGGIYSWAIRQGHVSVNPTAGVEKFKDGSGERYLTSSELERLGAAIREAETIGIEWQIDEALASRPTAKHIPKSAEVRRTKIGAHVAAALRLLVLTGARLREILHLEWTHIDFERGLIFLPDSKTGKKTLILNAPALSVLNSLPRIGRYVIAGDTAGEEGEKPRSDLKRPWELICRRAALEGVRIHDLRHTNASFGAGAGLGLPIIGKLLGHSSASTTHRYAHLDNDPLRRAADRIGGDIAAAMGEAPADSGAEVVRIRRVN